MGHMDTHMASRLLCAHPSLPPSLQARCVRCVPIAGPSSSASFSRIRSASDASSCTPHRMRCHRTQHSTEGVNASHPIIITGSKYYLLFDGALPALAAAARLVSVLAALRTHTSMERWTETDRQTDRHCTACWLAHSPSTCRSGTWRRPLSRNCRLAPVHTHTHTQVTHTGGVHHG